MLESQSRALKLVG